MPFELRDHTADVGVAASGRTLEAVFAAVADGLAAASCDAVPDAGDRFPVSVAAESREALLFDYLDELIYERDVRAVLPVDNEVRIAAPADRSGDGDRRPAPDEGVGRAEGPERHRGPERDEGPGCDDGPEWTLEGSARGVPLDQVDAREIKAVTYSEMRLEGADDGWEAYVVFDV